jgi:hypothetical protein
MEIVVVFKSQQRLFVFGICLLLLVQYHAYHNLEHLEPSLTLFGKNLVVSAANFKFPVAILEEDASFATFFRRDDHVISIPSIPIDCSRLLVVMTEQTR